jgi:putative protease
VDKLTACRMAAYRLAREKRRQPLAPSPPLPERKLSYLWNVANPVAGAFYRAHGATEVEPAFELSPLSNVPLMFTKHCLRYSMGWCPSLQKQTSPYQEPFYLLYKNTRLRLQFDCKNCQMLVFAEEKATQ